MVRGRRKDLTIPESRSLAQQRSYRDRKAKYLSDLEARCSAAEAEVAQLRLELAEARRAAPVASLVSTESHELLLLCSHLLASLSSTSGALSRFREHLLNNQTHSNGYNEINEPGNTVFVTQSGEPQQMNSSDSNLQLLISAVLAQQSSTLPAGELENKIASGDASSHTQSDVARCHDSIPVVADTESECCGGFVDCTDLP